MATNTYAIVGGGTVSVSAHQDGKYLDPRRIEIQCSGEVPDHLRDAIALLPRVWQSSDYSARALDALVRTRLQDDDTLTPPMRRGSAGPSPEDLHWQRRDGFDPSRHTKE